MTYSYKTHNIGEVRKILTDTDAIYIVEYKRPEYIKKIGANMTTIWKTKVDDLTINLDFSKGNIRYYDTETKIIEKESGEIIKRDERFYFHRDAYVKNEHIIIKGKEITQNLRLIDYTNDNVFFISNRCDLIKSIDINLNQQLWQYKIEDYFDAPSKILEGRVLVIEDRLVFFAHTEDWSNYATFILDAATGKVLFTTKELGMKLFKYNNQIYQIQNKIIKVLDPVSFKIKTIDTSDYIKEQNIFLMSESVYFHNDKLYVTAKKQNSAVWSIFLVFNLNTHEFEQQFEMLIDENKPPTENNKAFISDIQANDRMIAVQCSDRLYIFEKEENIS